MKDLMRHVDAVTALALPGPYRRLFLGEALIGYVTASAEAVLREGGFGAAEGALRVADAAGLAQAATLLEQAGHWRRRGEAFDVRAAADGPVLAQLDRGALPALGVSAEGVHVNGLVEAPEGWRIWIGTRADNRLLDPGKLDHLIGGGICAGMNAAETLVKEAAEEAGVPPALARSARPVGVIAYTLARPEGLRRDRLHCFDLHLPADFVPHAADGEISRFELMPAAEVLRLVRDTDRFKFNVSLVLIALFARMGMAEAFAAAQALHERGRCFE